MTFHDSELPRGFARNSQADTSADLRSCDSITAHGGHSNEHSGTFPISASSFPDPRDATEEQAFQRMRRHRAWAEYFPANGKGNDRRPVRGTLRAANNSVAKYIDHRGTNPLTPGSITTWRILVSNAAKCPLTIDFGSSVIQARSSEDDRADHIHGFADVQVTTNVRGGAVRHWDSFRAGHFSGGRPGESAALPYHPYCIASSTLTLWC
jgi:hypothetical protein